MGFATRRAEPARVARSPLVKQLELTRLDELELPAGHYTVQPVLVAGSPETLERDLAGL